MARPTNTNERRTEIVRGLVQVMARHGWDGASVARIAKAARLTPGLVHYHFTDKREILLEAVGALEARAADRVVRRLAAADNAPRARLDAFIDAYLATGRDSDGEAVSCWVVIAAEAVRDVRVRQAFDATLRKMAARLEGLFEDAGHSGARARVAAASVVSGILGALVVASSAPGLIPAGSAAASVKALAHALVNEGGG